MGRGGPNRHPAAEGDYAHDVTDAPERAEASSSASGAGSARRRKLPILAEIALAVAVVALVQAFLVKPFGVPSQSMENTLHIGDRILVNRLDTTIERGDVIVFGHGATWQDSTLPPAESLLKRVLRTAGDIIGIGPSNTAYTVKRVIGLPGTTVHCCDREGRIVVDGKALTEPYLFENLPFQPGHLDCSSTPRSTRCFPELTVPPKSYLVLGDHRSQSADSVFTCRGSVAPTSPSASSCARYVPAERVVGTVMATFWPLDRFGEIP